MAGSRAGRSSVTEQTGSKAVSESIDPVTVRGRLSHHLGRNYCSLSGSLVAFWESWQTLGALWRWRRVVEPVGRGPILRINDGGFLYSHWNRSLPFFIYFQQFYFLFSAQFYIHYSAFHWIVSLFVVFCPFLRFPSFLNLLLVCDFSLFSCRLNIIKTSHIPYFFCTLSPKFNFSVKFFNW